MLLRPHRRRSPRGFTLTETAIVLGVIGLLMGAIWVAAGMVANNNKTIRTTEQVFQIIANFKGVYGTHPVDLGGTSGSDITGMAISNNLLPADMILPGDSCTGVGSGTCISLPVSPWSGSGVTISAYSAYNGIMIIYSPLTQTACNHIGDALTTGNIPGLIFYNINAVSIGFLPPYGTAAALTPKNVATSCNTTSLNVVSVMYSMGM